MQHKLRSFLTEELGLPIAEVTWAERQVQQMPNQLPMILWQYGLISLRQLDKILDWLETA
ncbi:conserved hypothetical protein [Gloeothece citriformis PCC 7424]|uniref:DUF2949 domain-containing protein n=1 Tax=Gloeothece citriformis (strain PCC 7424) TaxID=65393 RepID=B7KJR3_GLOC7|nr:DUF2949 domain-containing protein [Gloeothece citriformis]ACK69512.1 conserved hypothetical protein [Gloeothece citriformis PCC 7424]